MAVIQLTQGKSAIVDDEDYERVNAFKWQYNAYSGYAVRSTSRKKGRRRTILMHVFIMDEVDPAPSDGTVIDHVNRNGLDNRRSNLERKTQQANLLNRGMFKNNTSGARGVRRTPGGRYQAEVKRYGETTYIGTYDSVHEASRARARHLARTEGEEG